MKKITISFLVMSTVLMLTGCSSKPTAADFMRGHAAEAQADVDRKNRLAADWEKGTKLISSGERNTSNGEKLLKAAEKDLKRAKQQIARGQQEITDGQKLVSESEQGFKELFPELPVKPKK